MNNKQGTRDYGLFQLTGADGRSLLETISEKAPAFDHSARQYLICYINNNCREVTQRKNLLKNILRNAENFDENKIDEYMEYRMPVTDWKIYYLLKRYDIDINDYGISFDFNVNSKHEEIRPFRESLQHLISDDELLSQYRDYKAAFIVDPLVFQNGINIIAAERGTGKTRLCLSLAYHILYRMDSFLGYPMHPHGDVLYLNLEIPGREFKTFIEPIKTYFARNYEQVGKLNLINTRDDLEASIPRMEEQIAEANPTLVIIDSFKMFINYVLSQEKVTILDNKSIMKFYEILHRWMNRYEITILLTNHTNKGTSNQKTHTDLMFGPGGLPDYADHTALVRRAKIPNQRLIIPDKSRYSPDGAYGTNLIAINSDVDNTEITIDLVEEDVNESDYLEASKNGQRYPIEMVAKAHELSLSGYSAREIAKMLNNSHSTISRWLKKPGNAGDPF